MSDLTRGPIGRHLAGMAAFIGAGLIFQAAYFVVDLFFVSRLGPQVVAGVASAGNFSFLALAASQFVGVGSLSLISQAVGRRDPAYANLVFNQVCILSLVMAAVLLAAGYVLAGRAAVELSADAASAESGRAYLYGFLPSMAIMFPVTAIGAALRAVGVVRPTMLVQTGAVLANVVLAPVLIAGWGTGHPLGALGAGLASSVAAMGSLGALIVLLPRLGSGLHADSGALKPRLAVWLSLMRVGLPAAGEFFLMFVFIGVIYLCIRRFGAQAQAGFGIGSRVMQSIFLPSLAISFAAAPIAGQNHGANLPGRVAQVFRLSAFTNMATMCALTLLCQTAPAALIRPFTGDPAVLAVGVQYLRVISWNFVGNGLIMTCSGMFQAFGDTRPSFISSASRLFTFCGPAIWLAGWPRATLLDFWIVSVASAVLQTGISLWLLRRAFRLNFSGMLPAQGGALAPAP